MGFTTVPQLYLFAGVVLSLALAATLHRSRRTLKDIRGPARTSFWLGKLLAYSKVIANRNSHISQVIKGIYDTKTRSVTLSRPGYASSVEHGRSMVLLEYGHESYERLHQF